MPNSREKGIRGELELRDLFKSYGFEARRGGQQGAGGSADAPDVIHSIPGIHVECKRVEAYGVLNRAMEQAVRDAGPDLVPAVFGRSNRQEWLITLRAKDFFNFLLSTGPNEPRENP